MFYESDSVINFSNVYKNYKNKQILKDLSFIVKKSDLCVFLGPNGAGKTTTIKIMLSFLLPDKGRISLLGVDCVKDFERIKSKIGVVFSDKTLLLKGLNVQNNLKVFAKLYNQSDTSKTINRRVEYLISMFELDEFRNMRVSELSSGILTRLSICKALINNPELLILDEPTANTDIYYKKKIGNILKSLNLDEKITILFTTHNMEEALELSSDVLFINKGRIEREGKTKDIVKEIGGNNISLRVTYSSTKKKRQEIGNTIHNYNYEFVDANTIYISFEESQFNFVLEKLISDFTITDIQIRKPSLEDLFK